MSELETPTSETPAPAPRDRLADIFSQANITTGLAVLAVVLAGAPYVMPKVASYQVEKGLLEHPTMMQDAQVRIQQQKEAAEMVTLTQGVRSHLQSLFHDPADPILGDAKAPIKIVEFLDYYCAHCRAVSPGLKTFLAENPDVAVIVKEYPVITQNSPVLAAYALAASRQGKYAEMHYALMNSDIHGQADLDAIVTGLGLDLARTKALAGSPEITDQVDRSYRLGGDIGVNGTPTFVVGSTPVIGDRLDALKAAVSKMRTAGTKG